MQLPRPSQECTPNSPKSFPCNPNKRPPTFLKVPNRSAVTNSASVRHRVNARHQTPPHTRTELVSMLADQASHRKLPTRLPPGKDLKGPTAPPAAIRMGLVDSRPNPNPHRGEPCQRTPERTPETNRQSTPTTKTQTGARPKWP